MTSEPLCSSPLDMDRSQLYNRNSGRIERKTHGEGTLSGECDDQFDFHQSLAGKFCNHDSNARVGQPHQTTTQANLMRR